ncbi:MAG: hypothetical protein KC777_23565 [Cyanobacteria bacterium HKST-UBA02]|nr:hypothetical protein [Cyanobacteria bacterium HKST-UBA02]
MKSKRKTSKRKGKPVVSELDIRKDMQQKDLVERKGGSVYGSGSDLFGQLIQDSKESNRG